MKDFSEQITGKFSEMFEEEVEFEPFLKAIAEI